MPGDAGIQMESPESTKQIILRKHMSLGKISTDGWDGSYILGSFRLEGTGDFCTANSEQEAMKAGADADIDRASVGASRAMARACVEAGKNAGKH